MTNILVFDTETTGLPERGRDYSHESQPHLVQLGAILFEAETNHIRAELNLIVHPQDQFTVPDGAANVHGITTEIAAAHGVPLIVALATFHHLVRRSDIVVAHNIEFDLAIMAIAYERTAKRSVLRDKNCVCTMAAISPIMQLPPTQKMVDTGMGHMFKAPSLKEAAEFIGRPPFDAHDAMADVREALAIYCWLQEQKDRVAA